MTQEKLDGELITAATAGDTEAVKLLVEAGANVNAVLTEDNYVYNEGDKPGEIENCLGCTPLMRACWNRHTDIVKLLLEHKADVNMADRLGWTALMYVCWRESKSADSIIKLLVAGADPNSACREGLTALMILALFHGNTDLMDIIINSGADVKAKDIHGETAFDILEEAYPDKYEKWMKRAVIKSKQKKLNKEDSLNNKIPVPDFNI